ncbi:MAG: acyltransferase [Mucilaginibacter sp.]
MIAKQGHLNSITLIRSIAAPLVLILHINFVINLHSIELVNHFIRIGNVGVYMFFIVSGFVLPYSLYKTDYTLSGFRKYFVKRSLRIDIPYWCMLIVWYIFLKEIFSPGNLKELSYHIFYLVPFIPGSYWFDGAYWTLPVEMEFYILLGLLYPLLIKAKPYATLLALLSVSMLCVFFINGDRGILFCNMNFAYFSIGIILFKVYIKHIDIKLAIIAIAPIIVYIAIFVSLRLGVTICLATLVILFLKIARLPSVIKFLATISYSLYLTHNKVLNFFIEYVSRYNLNQYILFVLTILICLIAAYMFYWLVERPALMLSKKILK